MKGSIYSVEELSAFIKPLLQQYGMASAKLFGPYARGEAGESSDIDVLLYGKTGFRPLGVFGLAEDLRKKTGKSVDAYEISELNEGSFRDAVLSEAIPV